MAKLRLLLLLSLTLFFTQQGFSSKKYVRTDGESTDVCDNGEYKIHDDLVDAQKECDKEQFEASDHSTPAGTGYCHDPPVNVDTGSHLCMDIPISYPEQIPSSGDYRPLPPVYGEYDYLPPQRWMCALTYGAVAFLYHPCAPEEQVMELRKLARTCLKKHIITPYSKLSENFPLALVSWGCVFQMSWVNAEEASHWLQKHALETPLSRVVQLGGYDYGLEKDAHTYTLSFVNDTAVCPSYEKVTLDPDSLTETTPPSTPQVGTSTSHENLPEVEVNPTTPQNSLPALSSEVQAPVSETPYLCESPADEEQDEDSFIASHLFLLLLILLLSAVVLGLVMVTTWIFCCREGRCCRRRSSRDRGKYKPVGKFFVPLFGGSDRKIVSIAIPEMGVPNAMPSEREILLVESDEDEV